eukprot:CAMPEP_0114273940 /NCGR_PEP_ID=MMETSP0058-20121206/29452_1 /TAXON_ID=36894 /ORGANISM="Pyramimonas parkeae, CCMP726" /LENGTH=978 /DNA_ID=CAMNT_0001393603 /DNA_START=127 /DNA_END=3064 /DNA_ORIENTATION=+
MPNFVSEIVEKSLGSFASNTSKKSMKSSKSLSRSMSANDTANRRSGNSFTSRLPKLSGLGTSSSASSPAEEPWAHNEALKRAMQEEPVYSRKVSITRLETPNDQDNSAYTEWNDEAGGSTPKSRGSKAVASIFGEEVDTRPQFLRDLELWLDKPTCTAFMAVVTIWALFGDDVRLLTPYVNEDEAYTVIAILCLIFFSIEIVLASISKPEYLLGFYFWLDLVATMSLVFDIPEAYTAITGDEQLDSSKEEPGNSGSVDAQKVDQSAAMARAGRTGRAGSKAGRIVRLVRLIRIVKLYKTYMAGSSDTPGQARENGKDVQPASSQEEPQDEKSALESKVGQKLSELTTRRVIIGVLSLLFILPLFDADLYVAPEDLVQGGLGLVVECFKAVHPQLVADPDTFDISMGTRDADPCLRALDAYHDVNGAYWINVEGFDFNDKLEMEGARHEILRSVEFVEATYENSFARFDIKSQSRLGAVLNILQTIYVCLVLGVGAMFFSKDANRLVLEPIERIFGRVRLMSDHPMINQLAQQSGATGRRRLSSVTNFIGGMAGGKVAAQVQNEADGYETTFLETTFSKLHRLIAIGFGEAGAEIVAANLKGGADFDPMIPGNKMLAIFGFCDIRQFTDATEVLQEGVMEYVNTIAHIVHMEVHLSGGSANKNIGDAFLLVWRFPTEIKTGRSRGHAIRISEIQELLMGRGEGVNNASRNAISKVADKALASFVIIQSMLNKSSRLRAYRENEELNKRIPDFQVKMGFGLHVGWAIEGAIGSKYKVDASYLSPNVNISSRLEAATKQFGTPMLLSEQFVNLLPAHSRERCRLIDRVTVKGSNNPMGFHTYDTVVNDQSLAEATGKGVQHTVSMHKLLNQNPSRDQIVYEFYKDPRRFSHSNQNYTDMWAEHPDLSKTHGVTMEFLKRFNEGVTAYIQGRWKVAYVILLECQKMVGDEGDGPSKSLLSVMAEHNNKAPDDWRGFRALTEK